MKKTLAVAWVGSLILASGCATKRYVAQQVDPVNSKISDVQKTQEEDERRLSATDEKATGADSRATDALGRADAASKKADQVKSDLRNELNDRIADLD